jgi:CheY-like chemotaxis protein
LDAEKHTDVSPDLTKGSALKKRHVLIIEDDPDSRVALRELLELWEYQVDVAEDGHEGLRVAETEHPSIVLIDIGIPGLDGYEVARHLNAEAPETRPVLVALTGWAREEDRKRGLEAGFDAYLTKPVDADDLKDLLAFATRE